VLYLWSTDVFETKGRAMSLVYFFGNGRADGTANLRDLLGGKGANLAEMTNLGLPVPPGFTISTEVCRYFYANNQQYPVALKGEVAAALQRLNQAMAANFGDQANPLLISVRSGARSSMPGMMDTILNLGINDEIANTLIGKTNNARFVYDSYRRFVQMYGDVVMGVKAASQDDHDPFELIIENKKQARNVHADVELTAMDLRELVQEFKQMIGRHTGQPFPEAPADQLWGAIGAVLGSWNNDRAVTYRKMNDIPPDWGTAVTVMAMVYGNTGEQSGTGVAFTRNAATGENEFYGEYLMNAQGEDVVAGIRTPEPIATLREKNPAIYQQLEAVQSILEKHYRDMMDLEFTIQDSRLFMLQCRVGKRTAHAAIRIAVDMVREGLISNQEALLRIEPDQLNQLLRPVFDLQEKAAAIRAGRLLSTGLKAGPGAAAGRVVFSAAVAQEWNLRGEKVILARIETSPEDIKGMNAAEGIITAFGGMTSHAALVARQIGKVCVASCVGIEIDYADHLMRVSGKVIKQGDWLSVDGSAGEVIEGQLPTQPSEIIEVLIDKTLPAADAPTYQYYAQVMAWADEFRRLGIRANADQPNQARNAIALGAEGIGLCRTEHMFFDADKIGPMREMILADTIEQRQQALAKLLPLQRTDFVGLFREMTGLPVTIRTIDPPLHEFLPHEEPAQRALATIMGIEFERVQRRVNELSEFNPMLGFRGCRLGIVYPEITEMQARAIFEATVTLAKEGQIVVPEVMIPLVGNVKELENQTAIVRGVAAQVMAESHIKFDYLVGTMIEVPRGALTADLIAQEAEFFSFGTNDLTQTTLGISRDDATRFIRPYIEQEIFTKDPFEVLDRDGVGELMKIAIKKGRATKPDLKIGICGEHGGEPSSVEFCHQIGTDYVSCSPFRVPIARLAAARAAIAGRQQTRK
jgi:pyruvate,orthophosphate dikinase